MYGFSGAVAVAALAGHLTRSIDAIGRSARALAVPRFGSVRPQERALRSLRDSKGRFALKVPREWTVTVGAGAAVATSARIGTLVRVDVLPETPRLWSTLIGALKRQGAEVRLRTSVGPRTRRIRAEVVLGKIRFDWTARSYPVGTERVVLSLGNVIDPARSRLLERYEDRILESILRRFAAPARS